MNQNRREFLKVSAVAGVGLSMTGSLLSCSSVSKPKMKYGLVTYQWGKDWNLPTLIKNCEIAGFEGIELRTQHAHGVETSLSAAERAEVKKRFADSPVINVGYGSNWEYHSPDPAELQRNIEQTKEYIKLCYDIGATGIKVKPNTLPNDVPREKTIAQIAASLNEVGKFGEDYGQLIRVEVHGRITQELPVMKEIFDQVTNDNVKICWNCNPTDLNEPGLEYNFNLVKQWLGDTTHIHNLDKGDYPYPEFFRLMKAANYNGWMLLEDAEIPSDIVAAMKKQRILFDELIASLD